MPEIGTSSEWLPWKSRQVSLYRPWNGPTLCGVKMIGMVRSSLEATGRFLAMLNRARKRYALGSPAGHERALVALVGDVDPDLCGVADPDVSEVHPRGTATNLVTGVRPMPDRDLRARPSLAA